jgi:5,10-methenyltetrahydrofolate synthetase
MKKSKEDAIKLPLLLERGGERLLLHACCAPCSSAIVEWLLQHDVQPTIFYYNPNIWPREEYEIRKEESKRHAASLGIEWIDGDYSHDAWLQGVCGLEGEPERGRRCEQCFTLRLLAAARMAQQLGIAYFATTLASSRWKSLDQINRAGLAAEQTVNCHLSSVIVHFWPQNWRKGGLQERRNQLLREYNFYNQQYCGCEFSAAHALTKPLLRQQMRLAKQHHQSQLASMSAAVVERLTARLLPPSSALSPQRSSLSPQTIMAYWPLPDEVDIRPLIDALVQQGKTVLLPKVQDDENMELRRYTSPSDLREGAFHIMEPIGAPFVDFDQIDVALVPGVAFDAAGHRLGRGKGYYDRFLHDYPYLHTIGVCFPFQRVAEVPTDEHDICVKEV